MLFYLCHRYNAEPGVMSHITTIKEEEEEDFVHATEPPEGLAPVPLASHDPFAVLAKLPPTGRGGSQVLQGSDAGGGRRHTSPQTVPCALSQSGEQRTMRISGTGEFDQ